MTNVKIVLPEGACGNYDATEKQICEYLRLLTRTLIKDTEEENAFGLGGQYNYGANFENDVFLFHKFCWCEKPDCPWCAGCTCPESVDHYFIEGKEVLFDEWIKYYEDKVPPVSDKNWCKISDEVNKHRTMRHDGVCDYCLGKGMFEKFALKPSQSAPNLWHKQSGLKVWWYKWIGRDMKVENPHNVNVKNVFKECLKSVKNKEAEK